MIETSYSEQCLQRLQLMWHRLVWIRIPGPSQCSIWTSRLAMALRSRGVQRLVLDELTLGGFHA